jgi:hypothetical protein
MRVCVCVCVSVCVCGCVCVYAGVCVYVCMYVPARTAYAQAAPRSHDEVQRTDGVGAAEGGAVAAEQVEASYEGIVTVSWMRVTAATLANRRPFTEEPAVADIEA